MKPLTSIEKRDLLAAQKFDPETVRAYADDFFAQARYGDAFAFYSKLDDAEAIRRVKDMAVEGADPEILWRIEHRDRNAVSREDWTLCGENAMRLGKFRSAAYVFERTGDEERLAAAQREFTPPREEPQSD